MTDARTRRRWWNRPPRPVWATFTAIRPARDAALIGALSSAGLFALAWRQSPSAQLFLLVVAGVALVTRSTVLIGLVVAWPAAQRTLTALGMLVPDDRFGVADLLAAVALVAYLLFALRHIELHREPQPSERRAWWSAPPGDPGQPQPTVRLRPLAGVAWRLALAPALALTLLQLVPLDAMMTNTARLVPAAWRAIVLLWGLAGVALVLAVVFSALGWRRLAPGAAVLSVHRALADELRREHAAIERARRRRARRTIIGD